MERSRVTLASKLKLNLYKLLFLAICLCVIIGWLLVHERFTQLPHIFPSIRYAPIDAFIVQPFDSTPVHLSLPDLNSLSWPTENWAKVPAASKNQDGTVMSLPAAFQPVMSAAQHRLLVKLLNLFSNAMFENGLGNRFFLYGGTLLGSYRHHDFIPWDDDVDVIVDLNVRPRVQAILRKLAPDYLLYETTERDKFYAKFMNETDDSEDLELSRHIKNCAYGYPFLDISYFGQTETHTIDIGRSYGRWYRYSHDVIFPLMFRPFGRYWYPAPYNTPQFLRLTYPEDQMCRMNGYSHVLESDTPLESIPCRDLWSRIPFVERGECKGVDPPRFLPEPFKSIAFVRETLIRQPLNDKKQEIHSLCVPMHVQGVNDRTYSTWFKRFLQA